MELLLQLSFLFGLVLQVIGQDVTFPVNNDSFEKFGKISNPEAESVRTNSCPGNMILHEADENPSDAICDCKLGFLYHPEKDSCYEPYRQGPCIAGHYLILPPGEISAKCEKNICLEDGLVSFQGTCARLGEYGPPCEDNLSQLGVESINFQLECSKPEEFSAIFSRVNAPVTPNKNCPKGSRRIFTGKCKRVFE